VTNRNRSSSNKKNSRGYDAIEIDSRKLPSKVSAVGANNVDPREHDFIGLAMQEPQFGSPGVRELLAAVAKSRVPCVSVMNMPPLPYMQRLQGLDSDLFRSACTTPEVWDDVDLGRLTLCSPDPQAVRLRVEKVNVLLVMLPTNFKVARFDDEKSNAIIKAATPSHIICR